jgi:anti-sigma B factor antagonist
MDELFQVTVGEDAGARVVTAVGEVDVSTAPELRERLHEIPEGSTVVVDLSGVTFLDSTGLGVLVAALKRVREGEGEGDLRLVVSRPQVTKVLEVTGLASVFSIFPTLDAALGR